MQGRDRREVPLDAESRRLWREIADATGDSTGFAQAGCLYLATNEKELAAHASWLETAREFSIDTRLVAQPNLETPAARQCASVYGRHVYASDCRAEPSMAVPAIAQMPEEAGATIPTHCAVRGLEQKPDASAQS